MVKKLFKHEFLAWLRIMPIIYGITLVVAAMLRVLMIFEFDSVYYDLVSGATMSVFIVALFVTAGSGVVFAIVRFYKNLFTGEGYLTHTLPVTAGNHLWVKALTALSFDLAALIVCLLSLLIVSIGDTFSMFCETVKNLMDAIPREAIGHAVGWVAEGTILFLVAMLATCLFYYLCICIGQLFRKNRVLAAVGVYFGFYMVSQVLSTVFMVVFMILGESGVLDGILEPIGAHPYAAVHIILCGSILLTALVALVYYWICHHIIRKKLNLE